MEVSIDESELCRACKPSVAGEPALVLTVKYPDGDSQRTRGVDGDDVRLISEFLAGQQVHHDEHGGETALKEHLSRLRELLGAPDIKVPGRSK